MQKTFQIIRGVRGETREDFNKRIHRKMEDLTKHKDLARLKVTLTEQKPPTVSVIPFGKSLIASINTVWIKSFDEQTFRSVDGYAGSFEVDEQFPVNYTRTWGKTGLTPGVCLLTLFRKKKNLPTEEFLDRWFNGHTPLTLKLHPIWHYSRNQVLGSRPENEAHYDGIVEEHCRTESELLNPTKFFGGTFTMLPNMIKTYVDVKGFLDYSSIEPYLVREYYYLG